MKRVSVIVGVLAMLVIELPIAAGTAESGGDFLRFMKDFYPAYKAGNWTAMTELAKTARGHDQYFDNLLELAESEARPGLESMGFAWSIDDFLGPAELTRIAFSLVAATQESRDPKKAKLTISQAKSTKRVWHSLYQTALTFIGAVDDPPPTNLFEPRDKLNWALQIANLLEDSPRTAFTIRAMGWLAERTGDHQRLSTLQQDMERLVQGSAALQWMFYGDASRIWRVQPIIKQGSQYVTVDPADN